MYTRACGGAIRFYHNRRTGASFSFREDLLIEASNEARMPTAAAAAGGHHPLLAYPANTRGGEGFGGFGGIACVWGMAKH